MTKTYKGLRAQFDSLPPTVRSYLQQLDGLLDGSDKYEIALAYTFMKLEEGNHRALKCGLVRLHKCNSERADDALEKQHFSRKYYRAVFKNIVGKPIPTSCINHLEIAESIRDRRIHGKSVSASDLRAGLSSALSYIKEIGEFVEARTGKNPFGDLRGLAGRAALLDKNTSYWVCKGVGLYTEKLEEN